MKTRWWGRFLKRTRCTLCVAVHTLCTLVVSIPMGSLYLRPLSTPDGSFRAQFPKGALKTPKSLYYQLLLRYLELLRHSTSKFLVEESWSWSMNCCGIFLHSELRRCPSILFWPLARPTLHWTLNKPSLRSAISSILIHFNFFYWIWNCLSLWLRPLSKLRFPLTSVH